MSKKNETEPSKLPSKLPDTSSDENDEPKELPKNEPKAKSANLGWKAREEACRITVKWQGKWFNPGDVIFIETQKEYESLVRLGAIIPRGESALPAPVMEFKNEKRGND